MSDTHSRRQPARVGATVDSSGIDTMHDVFSDWERRAILYCLQERDAPVSVERLAAHLVGWWRGQERPVSTDDEVVDQVCDRLDHAHLLKLDDFGVVSYDPIEGTVRMDEEMRVSVSEPWSDRAAGDVSARVLDTVAPRESTARPDGGRP